MIHFTGDIHGEQDRFTDKMLKYGEAEWNENDYLLIGGDFGMIFLDNLDERLFLDYLAQKPYTICFCDGNHENFPALYSYPKETWNGGRIHRIRHNVIHLMRGQVFTIDGKKIFTMGGAYSRDKYMRFEGLSWWKEELPNKYEYDEAIANLRENNYEVDYILTHTAPRKIIYAMHKTPDSHDMELTGFFDWIYFDVKYKKWFFGHWHLDEQIDEKHHALRYDVVDV